jgi:DNA-binding response OmpR family regulator
MVIDDSPSVRKIIEATFTRRGFHVSSFPDGISALKALGRQEIPVPSLVLLDLGLPRMDGIEVAGLLRGHPAFEHTILLMLTAHDGMWNRLRSKIVGAQGFISKPFRVPEVVQIVCAHLNIPVPLTDSSGAYGSPTT